MGSVGGHVRESVAAFRIVSANSGLRLIAIGRLGSGMGRWAATVAVSVVAYEHGGAQTLALVGVIRILPSALVGPLGAWLLGRMRATRLLLLSSAARTLVIGAAAVVLFLGWNVALVYVLVSVESLLSTMVKPLQTAASPFLARTPVELTASNLVGSTISSAGMLFGPLVAGLILAVSTPAMVLLVTALTYAVSFVLTVRLPPWEPAGARAGGAAPFADTLAGIRAIHSDRGLRLVVGLYCAENMLTGALGVLVVVVAFELLGTDSTGVGVLNAAIGVGGVAGGILASALLRRRHIASDLGVGLVLCGVPLALVAVAVATGSAVVLLAVVGVGITIVDFASMTLLQRAVPEDLLARVFSVLQGVFVGAIGLGSLVAAPLVSALGIRGALVASGAVFPALVSVSWRPLTRLDGAQLEADDAVDLLSSMTIFAPLNLPTLERLARALRPLEAPAGTTIVRQGDRGDSYYAIRRGTVDVSIDGRPLRTLGPGEGFGEIALLRDVPRTATIVAATHVDLYELDRTPFLEAVTGSPSSRRAADDLIDLHLGSLRSGLAAV
jgi:Cyclic nucleotide-binding domain/Major Facilitator Superfamily